MYYNTNHPTMYVFTPDFQPNPNPRQRLSIEGVLKLVLFFSPAKSRNISFFEQKKPMKLKKR
jgi:hypothetical protein